MVQVRAQLFGKKIKRVQVWVTLLLPQIKDLLGPLDSGDTGISNKKNYMPAHNIAR